MTRLVSGASSHAWPGDPPPRPYIMPDAGREAPGVSVIEGPPCSWEPSRSHQATRANYPPKGPGRVLPEKKFGGVSLYGLSDVLDVAGRVLPLSDLGLFTALQAPTSSCPGGLERVLPRRGLELSKRPRATPNRHRGLEVQTGAPPRGPRADPQHPIPRAQPDCRSRSQRRPACAGLPAQLCLLRHGTARKT